MGKDFQRIPKTSLPTATIGDIFTNFGTPKIMHLSKNIPFKFWSEVLSVKKIAELEFVGTIYLFLYL